MKDRVEHFNDVNDNNVCYKYEGQIEHFNDVNDNNVCYKYEGQIEHLNNINDNNVCYKLIDDIHILLLLPSYIYYHLLKNCIEY